MNAECISMDHANPSAAAKTKQDDKQPPPGPLSDDIHPPPTILNLDLVRMLERHLTRDSAGLQGPGRPDTAAAAAAAAQDRDRDRTQGSDREGAPSGRASEQGCDSSGGGGRQQQRRGPCVAGVPDIGPTRTMHLQMIPMVRRRAGQAWDGPTAGLRLLLG